MQRVGNGDATVATPSPVAPARPKLPVVVVAAIYGRDRPEIPATAMHGAVYRGRQGRPSAVHDPSAQPPPTLTCCSLLIPSRFSVHPKRGQEPNPNPNPAAPAATAAHQHSSSTGTRQRFSSQASHAAAAAPHLFPLPRPEAGRGRAQ